MPLHVQYYRSYPVFPSSVEVNVNVFLQKRFSSCAAVGIHHFFPDVLVLLPVRQLVLYYSS